MLQNELNKIWPGWTIKKVLGEGAFGKVYLIEREEFGYLYRSALKVVRIPQSKSEIEVVRNDGMDEGSVSKYFKGLVENLVDEFALMSKLKGNSNIVSYEDHAVIPDEDGIGWTIYIRMEYLTPLFDYIKKNPFTTKDVVKLGIDICKALEVCQAYKIIHRDIKPENIFVSELGTFKLGDFGIARQLEKTSSGLSKKGTYTYMAPEVFKGEDYNATVDIYSLGIVLYKFLNDNRTPFLPAYPEPVLYSDKETANRRRICGESIPEPSKATGLLSNIVLKACEYRIEDRYRSASEMRAELEALVLQPKKENEEVSVESSEQKEHTRCLFEEQTVYVTDTKTQQETEDETVTQIVPQTVSEEESKSGKNKKIIGIAVAVVLVIIIGIILVFSSGKKEEMASPEISDEIQETEEDVDIVEEVEEEKDDSVEPEKKEESKSSFRPSTKPKKPVSHKEESEKEGPSSEETPEEIPEEEILEGETSEEEIPEEVVPEEEIPEEEIPEEVTPEEVPEEEPLEEVVPEEESISIESE